MLTKRIPQSRDFIYEGAIDIVTQCRSFSSVVNFRFSVRGSEIFLRVADTAGTRVRYFNCSCVSESELTTVSTFYLHTLHADTAGTRRRVRVHHAQDEKHLQ